MSYYSKWTLRKQAALLLDTIAVSSIDTNEILTYALPCIQECFQHSNILIKESGMLALGALSNGCLDAMLPYIPQLFPFFLSSFNDSLPEMRCITCWVASRYSALFSVIYQNTNITYSSSNNNNNKNSDNTIIDNNNTNNTSSTSDSVDINILESNVGLVFILI